MAADILGTEPLCWRLRNTFLEFRDAEPVEWGASSGTLRRSASMPAALMAAAVASSGADEAASEKTSWIAWPAPNTSEKALSPFLAQSPTAVPRKGLAPRSRLRVARGGNPVLGQRKTPVQPGLQAGSAENRFALLPDHLESDADRCALFAPVELQPTNFNITTMSPQKVRRRSARQFNMECGSQHSATTVMIRHIACRYTESDVSTFLDGAGLHGKYDSVKLPLNTTKRANLGYVFVNFLKSEYVEECRAIFDGKAFGSSRTEKKCQVSLAHMQAKPAP